MMNAMLGIKDHAVGFVNNFECTLLTVL